MEWLQRLNQAIGYLEENLAGEIDYGRAAQIACCSTYHFQRMFSYLADMPLAEYIRRRRMTAAAFDLQNGARVLDTALKYGYGSPTAFNRAFQGVHGLPPSAAREPGAQLKAYPRITFSISIRGDAEMNYRIETKEAFRVVGQRRHFSMEAEKCFAQVPRFWQEFFAEGAMPGLLQQMDQPPYGVMGISTSQDFKDFDYYIAVSSSRPAPEGMEEYTVPACTWAIFESIGPMPQALQSLQKRIVTEWLPTSGYEYANAPDIELYGEGDQSAADYRCEAWLPIVKKA